MKSWAVAAALPLIAACTPALAEPLSHETAPRLSDEELQELTAVVSLAQDPITDTSQLAWAVRTIAIQQYRTLPAYRDLYQSTFDALIQRLESEVESPDAGRLLDQTIAVYEMLYRDSRWSERRTAASESAEELLPGDPWGLEDFHHPVVAAVDFPLIVVRQAVWVEEHETLLFTLEPNSATTVSATFRIMRIPTNYVARLEKDGRQIAAIDEHGQASGARVVNLGPGEIEITTTLGGPARFAIRPE